MLGLCLVCKKTMQKGLGGYQTQSVCELVLISLFVFFFEMEGFFLFFPKLAEKFKRFPFFFSVCERATSIGDSASELKSSLSLFVVMCFGWEGTFFL